MSRVQLSVIDYMLAVIFLCVSLGIGLFYGVFRKARTTDDYLYGNRNMPLFPVALSLIVTYQSANSCLGIPAEMYMYNSMFMFVVAGNMLTLAITAYTIVPLLYPLKLNSAYEYLGRRFNSRSVQLLGTFIGMLQALLYMSVVLFSPALALEAVADIPLWTSVVVVGVIGTIYTSIGGFRSVIWTDVFQFIILYGGLIVILILGINKIGGLGKVLEISNDGDRLAFNASFDPRVRHSLWSCVIGGMFTWFPNNCQQSAVQRISSMKSQRDAKIAVLLNVPLMFVFGTNLILVGLVIYAYFVIEQCGPVESGEIGGPNQLMPYFVMHILATIPGIAGLFLAALFSGALSSLSSGINALAVNTLQDICIGCTEEMSQAKQTYLAKVIVFVYGTIAVVLAYCMKSIKGPVTQISATAFGACGGPYFGMFCLGAMFPQANWIGALVGGVVGILVNVWLAIGALFHALPTPKSPPITTSGCMLAVNHTPSLIPYTVHLQNATYITDSTLYLETTNDPTSSLPPLAVGQSSMSGVEYLYNISYLYIGLTGFLVTLAVGLLISFCSGGHKQENVSSIYLFPFLRKIWRSKSRLDESSYDLEVRTVHAEEQCALNAWSRPYQIIKDGISI